MSIETRKRIALAKAREHQRAARAALDKPPESYARGVQDQKRALSVAINCLGHALSELEKLAAQERSIAVSGTISLRDYCKANGFKSETAIRAAGRGDIPGAAKIDAVWRVPQDCAWSPKAEGRPPRAATPTLQKFVCASCGKQTETFDPNPFRFQMGLVCDGCARCSPEAVR
jgi:hypothetical protein